MDIYLPVSVSGLLLLSETLAGYASLHTVRSRFLQLIVNLTVKSIKSFKNAIYGWTFQSTARRLLAIWIVELEGHKFISFG